jgi:hypothetical protein
MNPSEAFRNFAYEVEQAGIDWAKADFEARKTEKYVKRIFAQLIILGDEKSVAAREYSATCHQQFIDAQEKALVAETDANIAKAKLEAVRVAYEMWRTLNATAREEMRLAR